MSVDTSEKKREQNRQACRRWRERHKEYDRQRCRVKSQRDKARLSVSNRLWSKKNLKHRLEYNKKWRTQNPDRARANAAVSRQRRRARKRAVELGNPQIISEWMRRIRRLPLCRCHWCGTKVAGNRVHFDHIIPLSSGGPHSIDNLCASCEGCNCSKKDKSLRDWMANGQKFFNL